MHLRPSLLLGSAALLSLVVVGCGGGASPTPTASPSPSPVAAGIEVTTTEFKFDPSELTIPAGQDTTITLVNKGIVEHDLTIDALELAVLTPAPSPAASSATSPAAAVAASPTAAPAPYVKIAVAIGKTASGVVNIAEPGTYVFYCSVPGHRQNGMVGTLVVE